MTTQEERPTLARLWPRPSRDAMIQPDADPVRTPRARTQEELVEHFSSSVWRFVSSQISPREDAEDVVMEVFGAAFASFGKLERAQDQRVWLLTVARNKVASALRKRYRRAEQPLADAGLSSDPPSDLHLTARGALDQLPADQREALVLKYVNGLSTQEVARVLQRSDAAANSLLQRGREALRSALGPSLLEFTKEPS